VCSSNRKKWSIVPVMPPLLIPLLILVLLLLVPALLQDASKLQPGGFYLDRRPQGKHLPLGGTKYSSADVDRLWDTLEGMAAPALPAQAVA